MPDRSPVSAPTTHVLRPSVSGTLPPLPPRDGERLILSLVFTMQREGRRTARIYAHVDPPQDGEQTQFDGLAAGSVLAVHGWTLHVREVREDRVELELELANDA